MTTNALFSLFLASANLAVLLFRTMAGKPQESILQSHVYKTFLVRSDDECVSACMKDSRCILYAFKLHVNLTGFCELNECGLGNEKNLSSLLISARQKGDSFVKTMVQQLRIGEGRQYCKDPKQAEKAKQPGTSKACKNDWTYFNASCFKLFENVTTWQDAETQCVSHGSTLASIHSVDENNFARSLVTTSAKVWIGLNDIDRDGAFTWVDGTPIDYDNWGPRQPERGAEVVTVLYGLGEWHDYSLLAKFPFVCNLAA